MVAKTSPGSFTGRVLFDFLTKPAQPSSEENFLEVQGRRISLAFIHHARARRYLLRLRPDGSARVTIPRRGSRAEAQRFVERHTEWLARQLDKLAEQPARSGQWFVGTEILLRGDWVKLEIPANGQPGFIHCGTEAIPVPGAGGDLRPWIMRHLWRLAAVEFPPRVFELAAARQLTVHRVSVRNQRSRWGSCSRRGTISLNWRLVQAPPAVRDYVILHELMHLRQMNHSARFWREVADACPEYETAERWLKQHTALLHWTDSRTPDKLNPVFRPGTGG